MSATAAPFGLRPIGRTGAGGQEVMNQYPIATTYGTNICTGDIVMLVDNGTTTTVEKMSAVGDATTALDILGIFMGCSYTDPTSGQVVHSQRWPASNAATDAMAYVVDNPDVEFVIQADGAPTNTGDIYGKNSQLIQTAPNTTLNISRVALDISSLATTATFPIRVIDYIGGHNGDENGTSFPLLRCRFNNHQLTTTTGSA